MPGPTDVLVRVEAVAVNPVDLFVRSGVYRTPTPFVPDVIVDAAVPTKALLMLTHLVAAAIVVPAVVRRLT